VFSLNENQLPTGRRKGGTGHTLKAGNQCHLEPLVIWARVVLFPFYFNFDSCGVGQCVFKKMFEWNLPIFKARDKFRLILTIARICVHPKDDQFPLLFEYIASCLIEEVWRTPGRCCQALGKE
jgi:hypothetical protein